MNSSVSRPSVWIPTLALIGLRVGCAGLTLVHHGVHTFGEAIAPFARLDPSSWSLDAKRGKAL